MLYKSLLSNFCLKSYLLEKLLLKIVIKIEDLKMILKNIIRHDEIRIRKIYLLKMILL